MYGGTTVSEKMICVMPGDNFNVTCITNGSEILEWLSDVYIGTGNSGLAFASADELGKQRHGRNATVVTLTGKDTEGNATILQSLFSAIATVSSNITCHATTIGENSTTNLVVGK